MLKATRQTSLNWDDDEPRRAMLSGSVVLGYDDLVRRGDDSHLMEFHVDLGTKASADEGSRIIEGLASTGSVDRVGDIVEPSAFRRTLKRFKTNPIILAHHSPWMGMGNFTDYEITDKGFYVKGKVGTGTSPMDDIEIVWNRVAQRIYRAMSIGFRILKREYIMEEGRVTGWRILDLDLYEISIVAIPAQAEAIFDISKAVAQGTDLDFDLYARNLWGIPPKLTNIVSKSEAGPVVRPGRTLTEMDARIGGLTEMVALHAGGTR